ncbi:DUF4334 domain-containing protein [Actinoplanes sp. NPDC020271]|uniref:DUF4334 domain-containing protein n=1 Tax=Actinoplanes sp. NPDC020271 TaxID=3363896 RepID=UPI003789C5F3
MPWRRSARGHTEQSIADLVDSSVGRRAGGHLCDGGETAKGGASRWTVEFRGESTATTVHDGQPVLGHFPGAGENSLLGVMDGKGVRDRGRFHCFRLDRE